MTQSTTLRFKTNIYFYFILINLKLLILHNNFTSFINALYKPLLASQ